MLIAACLWYLALTSVLMVGPVLPGDGSRRGVQRRTSGRGAACAEHHRRTRQGRWRPMTVEAVERRWSRPSTSTSTSAGSRCSRASTWRSQPREVMCIIGPSGSGKSTFLRCINHLEKIDAGRLSVDGASGRLPAAGRQALRAAREARSPQQRRDIGMVFQRFNLFPHMTALRERHGGADPGQAASRRRVARERAVELLDRVGLGAKTDSYPAQLSGGQQQRVAIARALAMEPEADALRRADLRARPRAGRRGARRHAAASRRTA